MDVVCAEWSAPCATCGQALACVDLRATSPCPRCGTVTPLAPEASAGVLAFCAGTRASRAVDKTVHGVTCVARAVEARCPVCTTGRLTYDPATPSELACAGCGHRQRLAPPALQPRRGPALLGSWATAPVVVPAGATAMLALACPRCSGALPAPNAHGISGCPFCSAVCVVAQAIAGLPPAPQVYLVFASATP